MDITGMDILSITRAMGVIPTITPVIIGLNIMVATGIQVTTIRPLPSLDIVLLTSTEREGHHRLDACRVQHSLAQSTPLMQLSALSYAFDSLRRAAYLDATPTV